MSFIYYHFMTFIFFNMQILLRLIVFTNCMAKKGSRRSGRQVRNGKPKDYKGYGNENDKFWGNSDKTKENVILPNFVNRKLVDSQNIKKNSQSKIMVDLQESNNILTHSENDTKYKMVIWSMNENKSKNELDQFVLSIVNNLLDYLETIDENEQRELLRSIKSIVNKEKYDLDELLNFILKYELYHLYPKPRIKRVRTPIEFHKDSENKKEYNSIQKLQLLKNKLELLYDSPKFGFEKYYLLFIIKCLNFFISNNIEIFENHYKFLTMIAVGKKDLKFIDEILHKWRLILISNIKTDKHISLEAFNDILNLSCDLTNFD